jgi:Fe-S cluster biogenesis protein NfuA
MSSKLKEKVEKAIKKIRPSLKADGGDVKLIEITEDGVVKVRLTGACSGCMMSEVTLKYGIERYLKQRVPEVKKVEAVF